jgi:hypothetical protein
MIQTNPSNQYWNYFLALEDDVKKIGRFIEVNEDNLQVYSIELARILLSASSEVDVLLKQLCFYLDDSKTPKDINAYKKIIKEKLPEFINEPVFVYRYGFQINPWGDWNKGDNPDWWSSHNKVKHLRHIHFNKANVENVLKAMSGLLICVAYYYKFKFQEDYKEKKIKIDMNKTCEILNPKSKLFKFKAAYHQYPVNLY